MHFRFRLVIVLTALYSLMPGLIFSASTLMAQPPGGIQRKWTPTAEAEFEKIVKDILQAGKGKTLSPADATEFVKLLKKTYPTPPTRAALEAFLVGPAFEALLENHVANMKAIAHVKQPLHEQPGMSAEDQAEFEKTKDMARRIGELYTQGRYDDAIAVAKTQLAMVEKSAGTEHPHTAAVLDQLAALYSEKGDFAEVEPIYNRLLRMYEKFMGPEDPETAVMLTKLARAYVEQGKYSAARPAYERALKIREKAFGPEHSETALSLNNLAELYFVQGDDSAAEPLYERALRILDGTLGVQHPYTAVCLNNLASLREHQADFVAARLLYQRAQSINDTALGSERPEAVTSSANLALFLIRQGDYAAAEPLLRRALEVTEKSYGSDNPRTARCLNNLAALYTQQANYAAARTLNERALKIYENVLGLEHPNTATCVNNLATLSHFQGDYVAAETLYQRALTITEHCHGPEHPATATCLNNLALLYADTGTYAAAEQLYKRAQTIKEKVLFADHPETALGLTNLGHLNVVQHKYTAARSFYLQALSSTEKVLGSVHPTTALCLNDLSCVEAALGNAGAAMSATDRARRIIRTHVSSVLPALSDHEQELFLAKHYGQAFRSSLSLALSQKESSAATQVSAAWLVNGKAVAQEALAQRNLLTRDLRDPKRATVVKDLQQARRQLAAMAMSIANPDQADARRARMAELSADEQRLSHDLYASGGGVGQSTTAWIEIDQIRKALPAKSVLIDIARFEVYDSTLATWQPARYAAWITQCAGRQESVLVDLGLAEEIDLLVTRVRADIQGAPGNLRLPETSGEDAATSMLMKDLRSLADRIWKPLEPHVGDCEQIIVSPDGALWLTPWNALPVGTSQDAFLIEKYCLRYVVSGRDLLAKHDDRPANAPVILANPLFDQEAKDKQSSIQAIFKTLPEADDTTTRSFSAQSLLPKVAPLPNTGIEALAIQPNVEKFAGQKATLYKEHYALERVAKVLKNPKVATFSTHGFFLPTQEKRLEDRIAMADNTRAVALDTSGQLIENPLLRCGLLLSGCNNRDASVGDDDGILTGMEIVGIDFRGTELVVLSACETGVGDVKNGEGVAGLRQAFQLAGAEAVVATLWQVPDRDSALLMSKFFEELAAGKSKSEALRAAQLERIKSRRDRFGAAHPFYWAAFTLTGQ